MARPKQHSRSPIVLHPRVEVRVSEVPFKPFDSLRHLDIERLRRAARARFEVGTFESGCCRRVAYAVVRKGMVTKLEFEPCQKTLRVTPELERVVRAAWKELAARRSATTSLPIPVSKFLAKPVGPRFSAWFCLKICCFGHCIMCCFHIPGIRGKWIWLGCAIDAIPTP